MADPCDRPDRVLVEIGRLPGRFWFTRAAERVYRSTRPFLFVSGLPDPCDPEVEYVIADCFPVRIDALRVYFTAEGRIPDLVQAFNPPLAFAEGDLLEPTIPADLPEACRTDPV